MRSGKAPAAAADPGDWTSQWATMRSAPKASSAPPAAQAPQPSLSPSGLVNAGLVGATHSLGGTLSGAGRMLEGGARPDEPIAGFLPRLAGKGLEAAGNWLSSDQPTPQGAQSIARIGQAAAPVTTPIASLLSSADTKLKGAIGPQKADAAEYLAGMFGLPLAGSAAGRSVGALGHIAADAARPVTAPVGKLIGSLAGDGRTLAQRTRQVGEGSAFTPKPAAPSPMQSPQSVSAAAASPNLAGASPQLRAVVTALQAKGAQPNPQVLERHLRAESLPVPSPLSLGQATQDPVLISVEQNQRGNNGGFFAQQFDAQNKALAKNFQAMRDRVGPDVYTTSPVAHGDTLIESYQKKDEAARGAIDSAFDKARGALPPTTPVLDAKGLLARVNSALGDKWATESAPADIMKRLQTLAEGPGTINAGEFEGLRSRLAELARSGDGSSRYAANLIRGAVEDSDLLPGTEAFKAPFDQARSLARARFQALEKDRAYAAAVNETVPPDQFVQRFVTGTRASRDDVATMRANLAHDPVATQTMGVAALDHLRQTAAINDKFEGNFAQASYNKALQGLAAKMPSLFNPKNAEALANLGEVARDQQFQPKGSFVSTANTVPGILAAEGKGLAAKGLEHIVNAKTLGVGGTVAKKMAAPFFKGRTEAALLKRHFAPGAGLDYSGVVAP